MNDDGFYSFDENALLHASMGLFESQPDNQSFTAEQAPANETFTAGGMNGFAPASNFYAAAESTNEFAAANNYAYAFSESTLPQPTVSTHQEMLEGQYALDQFGIPQAATNIFEFDSPINTQFNANDFNNATWGASTAIDHQVFEKTITDLSAPNWASAGSGLNALSGDTTASLQPTSFTGSDADAPFEVDESECTVLTTTHQSPESLLAIDQAAHSHVEYWSYDLRLNAANNTPKAPSQTRDRHMPMHAPWTCPWSGCNKTTPFKTEKLLRTHLDNIHLNPLHCTQQGCFYNRPFSKKGDLDRHLASKHGIGRLFRCPRRECPRHTQPFGRKDKLREHVNASGHGRFPCQIDHCQFNQSGRGLLNRENAPKHEMSWHGEYECAIGNCAGSISRFSDSGLKFHVYYHHNISYRKSAIELLKQGSKTLTLADVSNLGDGWYGHRSKGAKTACAECEKNGRSTNPSGL